MTATGFLRANAPYLAAGALLTFASSFGQTFFISVFAAPIRAEFGLTNGDWGAIYATGTMASAAVMVWAGGLTDRIRARALGAGVLVMLAGACAAMGLVQAVWALPVVIFFLRLAGQGMTSHIATVAMARWFVATRGRALSIASLGFAAGEALLPMSFVALMGHLDWRWLWFGCAGFVMLLVPVLGRLLRLERAPRTVAAESQAVGMGARHWQRREVLGHWLFWCVLPSVLAPAAFSTAFFFQQVPLAAAKGWSHIELVALFPVFTSVAVAGMVLSGWVIDRVGSARLMPVYLLPMAVGFALMGRAEGLWAAGLAMAFMGLSQGMNSTLPAVFWAEFFGTRHLGAIKATAAAAMVLGSAMGPWITGAVMDSGIDMPAQMPAIAAVFVLASALNWFGVARARPALSAAA